MKVGAQEVEVIWGGLPHLTCKHDHIKMRDYMDRRVNPPKRVTSPIWCTPPPCNYKQALSRLKNRQCTCVRKKVLLLGAALV